MSKLRALVVGILAAGALSGAGVTVVHSVHGQGTQHVSAASGCTMGWPLRDCGKPPTS